MENKNVLSIIGGLALLTLIVLIFGVGFGLWGVGKYQEGLFVATDKTKYASGDNLKFKIRNNSEKKICFSSCYPYYFEKEIAEGKWEAYQYSDCQHENLVENCIDPKQTKAFQTSIPSSLEKKTYRLAIPACVDCSLKAAFKESKWLYSNEFIIK